MKYNINPIIAGYFGPIKKNNLYCDGSPNEKLFVPSYIYSIKSSEKNILVDTSFGNVDKWEEITGLKCKREKSFEKILESHDIDPLKIDTVICTHLHWDHFGNANLFSNANIICQKEEIPYAVAPPSWMPGYEHELKAIMKDVIDRITFVKGNKYVFNGIRLVKLGGHSPGSQVIVIDSFSGKKIIAGDIIMNAKNLEDETPIGLYTNLEECEKAIFWLKNEEANVIYPGHGERTYETS